MPTQDNLSTFLQENLITLLCYDDDSAPIIRGAVKTDLFEGPYRTIVQEIYHHLDTVGRVPGDHVVDLFETTLEKGDRKARQFRQLFEAIRESREEVDPDFVMTRLATFVRMQEIKAATLEVAELVQTGRLDDDAIEKAEGIFTKAIQRQLSLFDAGVFLGDWERTVKFLEHQEEEAFSTGIAELDRMHLGPARKCLHLFIGLPKRGKTWWLVNLGKCAYLAGRRVVHVSLEMSERKIVQRYYQAMFALAKRRPVTELDTFYRTQFRVDEDGRLEGLERTSFEPRYALDDDATLDYLARRLKHVSPRLNRVIVKDFPTGQLTIPGLSTYLNNLETRHHFKPDLLIVDYPQLMQFDARYQRLELGKIIQQLRGIAVERDLAVAIVGQSHRKALKVREVDLGNIAEDFSMVATADVVFTYSQTREERALGLARIHVAAGREEADQFTVLISQHYATGQFCRDSVRMQKQYWEILDHYEDDDDEDEDEEETERD